MLHADEYGGTLELIRRKNRCRAAGLACSNQCQVRPTGFFNPAAPPSGNEALRDGNTGQRGRA
jgi:hypothetical protein